MAWDKRDLDETSRATMCLERALGELEEVAELAARADGEIKITETNVDEIAKLSALASEGMGECAAALDAELAMMLLEYGGKSFALVAVASALREKKSLCDFLGLEVK